MAKARILVVEDDDKQRQLYCEELIAAGYDTLEARNASEAEDLLNREQIDLIILDINMPGVSGLELLPRIHELHPGMPVIIHTAYGSYRDDFISWLADMFIVKSPDAGNLVEAVEDLLSRQREKKIQREVKQEP
ncbi:response regulator [Fervidibacter sacchari]|jgi:Response regulator containing CheY-like receiver, AAA-type ATPase, and DNA-binding domains|uniref:DNA-binding NtrC family response regulator n=1 Tax=Candidatus Fervidibacter sacchari TaxID=1448929 RepID=A0ABT2EVR0_9BACT|nr:response regulator [Candidatus Fervidibacter sacchari]MCS3920995.1 DNA-binding NtrC family response regulator [Candidatus Fervidibacter sacchari]WKU14937.1 response regulator [Candidatus Fervidibacter sacchari]